MSSHHPPEHKVREIFHGRLNLEQQKKRAKALLKSLNAGAPEALQRLRRTHPNPDHSNDFQLADAQLVLARENGFESWPKMKAHCKQLAAAKQRIDAGEPDRLDTSRTLHIRCGSDIRRTLKIAGFGGNFLEFADPYCQGPVPDLPDDAFIATRANFVAKAYGMDLRETSARLDKEYAALKTLDRHAELVLWFEHDTYDQLILARLLYELSDMACRDRAQIICVDSVPGVNDFTGLGQLSPEALQWLWKHRREPVSDGHLALGRQVWRALTNPDPTALFELAKRGTPAIPCMANALGRHLRELPSTFNGLGLTQQLTLEIIAERESPTAGDVFRALCLEREPLPYLGDTMFWHALLDLGRSTSPLFDVAQGKDPIPWPKRRLSITDAGRKVLDGSLDFLSLYQGERWVGGVRITGDTPCPKWDKGNRVIA